MASETMEKPEFSGKKGRREQHTAGWGTPRDKRRDGMLWSSGWPSQVCEQGRHRALCCMGVRGPEAERNKQQQSWKAARL